MARKWRGQWGEQGCCCYLLRGDQDLAAGLLSQLM